VSPHPFQLPGSYRKERELLERAGMASWEAIACLDREQLRRLASASPGSEARLLRLRGQAQLVIAIDLAPAEAALLLHAGIADASALAEANPEDLRRQVGRLQRRLTGSAVPPPSLATLQAWILQARASAGRSRN
jgi:hypothetical protein